MSYSDVENSSAGEIFSDDEINDLFNDEAAEDGDCKSSAEEEVENKKVEESKVKVAEKKKPRRVVKNPRKPLNFDTLRGNNGLGALKKLFEDFKFKGNGHEKEDLTRIMTILQQWMSYQLYPSYNFETCMLQLENLGKKKVVQTLMKKYRSGIAEWGENHPDMKEKEKDNLENTERSFDTLLDEEIARAKSDGEFSEDDAVQTRVDEIQQDIQIEEAALTPEQLERIARNRKLAEERRLKRMNRQFGSEEISQLPGQIEMPDKPETIVLEENT